jgi:hypothetical protein
MTMNSVSGMSHDSRNTVQISAKTRMLLRRFFFIVVLLSTNWLVSSTYYFFIELYRENRNRMLLELANFSIGLGETGILVALWLAARKAILRTEQGVCRALVFLIAYFCGGGVSGVFRAESFSRFSWFQERLIVESFSLATLVWLMLPTFVVSKRCLDDYHANSDNMSSVRVGVKDLIMWVFVASMLLAVGRWLLSQEFQTNSRIFSDTYVAIACEFANITVSTLLIVFATSKKWSFGLLAVLVTTLLGYLVNMIGQELFAKSSQFRVLGTVEAFGFNWGITLGRGILIWIANISACLLGVRLVGSKKPDVVFER